MAAKVFKIEGLKEVQQAMKQLPDKLAGQILKRVNSKAARDKMNKPVASKIPYKSARNAMLVRKGKGSRNAVIAGPSSDVFYVRFADKGTVERYTKTGAYRGKIKGRFAFRKIHAAQDGPLLKYTREEYTKETEKALRSRIKSTQKKISKL